MDWSFDALPWEKLPNGLDFPTEYRCRIVLDGAPVRLYRGRRNESEPWQFEILISRRNSAGLVISSKSIRYRHNNALGIQAILFDAAERGAIRLDV